MNTPAPWITVEDLGLPVGFDADLAEEAIEGASWVLWMLSARKYGGVRQVTELYCQVGLRQSGSTVSASVESRAGAGMQVSPMLRAGSVTNEMLGACSSCGCEHTVRLRGGPVLDVVSVYDGDRQVPLCDVAIYDYSYITAPNTCWGTCSDLEVTYRYGTAPPAMGRIAARELASQYLLAMAGDEECVLPQRVTQISRQGVSWTLLDPQDFLDSGRTGLYTVDLFLRTANPDRARLRSRVFSPDLHRGRSYRWAATVASHQAVPRAMAPQLTAAPKMTMAPIAPPPPADVQVYTGRPLRWVVPGSFTVERPPVVTVQPSGEEVPPGTLLWRSGNYTLDLTTDQVEQLLLPGSVLVVSSTNDNGSTTSQTSHLVERRAL